MLYSDAALSFWGGVEATTGLVVDRHHPLCGQSIAGKILVIPGSRGSCTGSGVMLELVLNARAPAALVVVDGEEILPLGVMVGEEVFAKSIPVASVDADAFARLKACRHLRVSAGVVEEVAEPGGGAEHRVETRIDGPAGFAGLALGEQDRAFLAGQEGEATRVAMRIVLRFAELLGARRLIDVRQAHIDGCIYTGPGGLGFAEKMAEWGGRTRIPTTLNAVSVDCRRWRDMGVDPAVGAPASRLAETYVRLGAQPTFTCAPYLLATAPAFGEQIAWAESNAVVYANSVIGARTMKYPDFVDICIALTGRAPDAGGHGDAGRRATLKIEVPRLAGADESFFPLLGYLVGDLAKSEIPLIVGLEQAKPTLDELKSFGAAFATTSSAPMFHIAGITPEATTGALHGAIGRARSIGLADLVDAWHRLNSADGPSVELISIGSPHVSIDELARMAALCRGRNKKADVAIVVACGRAVYERASEAGSIDELRSFGVEFVTDTCWCMLGEPVVAPRVRAIMTNSAKYAHYAPALTGRPARFGSLADCVHAACDGRAKDGPPSWLVDRRP